MTNGSVKWLCWALCGLALSNCKCQEDDLKDLKPIAAVDPSPIDFQARRVGADTRLSIKLLNTGTSGLNVTSITVEPEGSAFKAVQTVGKEIKAVAEGQSEPFEVVFHPPVRGVHNATLVVVSDDRDTPRLEVPITGIGGPPRIKVTPEVVNFDLVQQGTPSHRALSVENTGLDTLNVTEVTLDPSSNPGFSLPRATNFLEGPIGVGENATINIDMDPTVTGPATGTLHIASDADGTPDKTVSLVANANLGPLVKVVEKQTRQNDYQTDLYLDVVLDSSDTTDPEGDLYTLSWTMVERPLGSQAFLEERSVPAERQLYIDTVGIYTIEVTGRDARGAVGVSRATVRAVRDLALRLTWEPAVNAPCRSAATPEYQCGKTDVDLHLVAPNGTVGDYFAGCSGQPGCDAKCRPTMSGAICLSQGLDCAYANRRPDWHVLGDISDDPRQDIDDVYGAGPENISMNNPVEGDYVVQVHFCNDRLTDEGAVAKVEVFFKGVPAPVPVLGPVNLPHEGSLWLAGIVHYNPNAVDPTPKFTLQDFNASPAVVDGPADLCNQ